MRIKPLFIVFGFGLTLANHIALFIIFLRAYLNPTRSTLVYIDYYGEANIELIAHIIISIIGIIGFFYVLREQ